jgi:cytochrome P450
MTVGPKVTTRPPGPRSFPPVVMLKRWWNPLRLVNDAARYGDIACLVTNRLYLINHPAFVAHVLRDRAAFYCKNPRTAAVREPERSTPPRREPEAASPADDARPDYRFIGGQSVALSEGEAWRRQRSLVQPIFNRRVFGALSDAVAAETSRVAEHWRGANRSSAGPLDIEREATDLVLRIWVRALFGEDAGRDTERIVRAIADLHHFFEARSRSLVKLPRSVPTPANLHFRRTFEYLTDFFYDIIGRRQRDPSREPDLLDALIQVRDRKTAAGLTRRQLHDELLMLSLLGHRTTATTLTWTLYLISQTPAAEQRVCDEVTQALGGRAPGADDVPKLTYLRQVLEESMRLYPAAWLIGRVATEDDEIGGYRVPARATVMFSPYLLHRHPGFWEQPDRFDPERFSAAGSAGRQPYVYLPFGEGERACMAGTFAMTQLTLILATLVPRFRFSLVPGHPMTPKVTVVLYPCRGLPMTVHARSSQPERAHASVA